MPRTGRAHLFLWRLMQCNMGKQCPEVPPIFIHISQKQPGQRRASFVSLHLPDLKDIVLNSLSKGLLLPQIFHFYITKAEQPPQFRAACTELMKQSVFFLIINVESPIF